MQDPERPRAGFRPTPPLFGEYSRATQQDPGKRRGPLGRLFAKAGATQTHLAQSDAASFVDRPHTGPGPQDGLGSAFMRGAYGLGQDFMADPIGSVARLGRLLQSEPESFAPDPRVGHQLTMDGHPILGTAMMGLDVADILTPGLPLAGMVGSVVRRGGREIAESATESALRGAAKLDNSGAVVNPAGGGQYFRAGSLAGGAPRGASAADVLRYEAEAGKDIPTSVMQDLAKYEDVPAEDLVWVGTDRADMMDEYGPLIESIDDIADVTDEYRGWDVLAEDPSGTMLIRPGSRPPSLPMDEASRMARAEEQGFDTANEVYHGTARPDRIEEVGGFDPERATSGPSAYFTSDTELAGSYAVGKPDTSRIDEGRSFSEMFKFKTEDGSEVALDDAWNKLTARERIDLRENLGRVTQDWDNPDYDGTGFVWGEGPGGAFHWEHAIKTSRNPLKAAEDVWLNSGTLFGEEQQFLEVLEMAGLPRGKVRFDDPFAQNPGIVPAYIRRGEVLDVQNDNDALTDLIARLRDKPVARNAEIDSDMWSKDRQSSHEWADALESDLEAGNNSFAWTSIPDAVSDELRLMGYNTIEDVGGKGGGPSHTVTIPLDPSQIRSRHARFDPAKLGSADLLAGSAGLLGANFQRQRARERENNRLGSR